jgi:hypothetical protein
MIIEIDLYVKAFATSMRAKAEKIQMVVPVKEIQRFFNNLNILKIS